jgi:hypothetical protein
MSTREDDYLWNPAAESDPEISELEAKLRPYSARALNLETRVPLLPTSIRAKRGWPRWYVSVLATAAAFAGVTFFYFHRLTWTENAPWPVTVVRVDAKVRSLLQVGESITTGDKQTATVSAARIGKVEIAENSSVALIQTGNNRHRLELKYGRLHAKIWAPPMYFGVANRDGMALDMGCEFEIMSNSDGSGSLTVVSGWVNYRLHGKGVLVPEGHSLTFNGTTIGMPFRENSDAIFRELVTRLNSLVTSGTSDETQVNALATRVAATADEGDRMTLLILVSRHRELLQTALYARLVAVFGNPGDGDAIDTWWSSLPKQPKMPRQWWLNWRDAF